ncbi:MAG TPA: TonB system transport protein ExbD [Campylobacterales bacterium]|nr:TonB system transport protein ExbD [Campylobacterales bacterium]
MRVKKFDNINIIPFVDVLLVLLAIILITSTLVDKKIIPLSLPSSSSQKELKKDDIVITIKKNGELYFQKEIITLKKLDEKLLTLSNDSFIAINCDKDSRFENFVDILDMIKAKNFDNLSIITKDE